MKKLTTITLSIFSVLLSLDSDLALSAPIPNQDGDYPAPPSAQINWQVVDSDPKGLNCRMAREFQGVLINGDNPPTDLYVRNRHDISKWPVVFTFRQGQRLKAVIGNMANQIMLIDQRGKTWLPVSTQKGTCFVRAHRNFIKPI